MNIKTGLSIYNKPWLIEPQAAMQLLDYWERVKAGTATWNGYKGLKAYDDDDDHVDDPSTTDYAVQQKFFASAGVVFSPTNNYDLRNNFKGFEGAKVAVIPISGPLMKADNCGDFGTASLARMVQKAAEARSVETVLFPTDSPGGTVDGTEYFADMITYAGTKKETITVAEGMMCSAAYWTGSASKKVYASGRTSIVGSIGTMMSWRNYTKMLEKAGIDILEFYATASTDKNAAIRIAEKTGEGKQIIQQLLDPLNEVFLGSVKKNRAGKLSETENTLSGKTYVGADAVKWGLADEIKSLEQAITESLEAKPKPRSKIYSMSKTILVFQNVLVAAKANEFAVVEGGFLMSEEQLTAIDAHIEQQNTLASATAAQLKVLATQAAGSADVTALQAKLDTATATIATHEATIAGLKTANEDFKTAAVAFTAGAKADGDKGAAHETEEADGSNYAHNKELDDLIG